MPHEQENRDHHRPAVRQRRPTRSAAGLPDELGVPFYDKELLAHAAKESGMAKELFENYDEAPTNSLLYSLSMGAYSMGNLNAAAFNLPLNHKVFLAQFDAIKKLAEQGGASLWAGARITPWRITPISSMCSSTRTSKNGPPG